MQNMTDRNILADKQKIGVFGGAFNPVHNGHINLASLYFDRLSLDKIIFIPTFIPPHKSADGLASCEDRMNMLRLAVGDNPNFEISDIEYKRGGKSYTYDTLQELNALYENAEFYLIVGADQFLNFHTWYNYREILKSATLCTSARESEREKARLRNYAKTLDGLNPDGYYILDEPVLRVSSSEIREKIRRGGDISSLVPAEVEKYIREKKLYEI